MRIKYPSGNLQSEREYIVQCKCGTHIKLPGWVLINKLATSCGCESKSKLVQARRRAYTGHGKPYPIFYNAEHGTFCELDQLSDNEEVEFALEINSCHVRERCPICYMSFRPGDLAVKIKDTGDFICDNCIDELTPEYSKIMAQLFDEYKKVLLESDAIPVEIQEFMDIRLSEIYPGEHTRTIYWDEIAYNKARQLKEVGGG